MKHWHRCRRWEVRGISCPFAEVKDHEDRDGPGDDLTYSATARARVPVGVPLGSGPGRPTVGVREPRRVPAPLRAGSLGVRQKVPKGLVELLGIPYDEEEPFGGAGKVALPATAGEAALDMGAALSAVPRGLGRPQDTSRGLALKDLAEVAAAEGQAQDRGAQLATLLALASASSIPLLRAGARAVRQMRPGLIGRAGPMDPPSRYNPVRASQGKLPDPKMRTKPFTTGARPIRSASMTGGGGGFTVQARKWLPRMVKKVRSRKRAARPKPKIDVSRRTGQAEL